MGGDSVGDCEVGVGWGEGGDLISSNNGGLGSSIISKLLVSASDSTISPRSSSSSSVCWGDSGVSGIGFDFGSFFFFDESDEAENTLLES